MPVGMVAFGPIAAWVGNEWTLLGAATVAAVANIAVAFAPGVRAVETPALAAPAPAA
jgi:hypothetical protein